MEGDVGAVALRRGPPVQVMPPADEAQPAHFVAMVRTSPLAMEMMSTPEEQGIPSDGEDARVPPPG